MQEDRADHNASQRLKHAQDRAQPRPGILHAVLQEDRSTDVIQEGDQRNDPEIRQDAPKLQRRSQRAVDQAHNGHEQADIEGERLPVFLLQNARALHVQQLERPRKDGQHSKQEAALRARRDIFKKEPYADGQDGQGDDGRSGQLLPEQHRLHHRNKRGVHKVDRCDCSDRQIQIRQIQKDLCRHRPENAVQRDLRQTAQFDGWGLAPDAACQKQQEHAAASASDQQRRDGHGLLCRQLDERRAKSVQKRRGRRKYGAFEACLFHFSLSDVKKSYALRRMPPVVRRRHTQRRIWAVSSWYSISSRSRRMASSVAKYAALLS